MYLFLQAMWYLLHRFCGPLFHQFYFFANLSLLFISYESSSLYRYGHYHHHSIWRVGRPKFDVSSFKALPRSLAFSLPFGHGSLAHSLRAAIGGTRERVSEQE